MRFFTKKPEKVSKKQQKIIELLGFSMGGIIAFFGLIQGVLIFANTRATDNGDAPREITPTELARKEIIKERINPIQTFVLIKNENIAVMNPKNINLKSDELKETIVPFFLEENEGNRFIKTFIRKGTNIKTKATNMGFIYEQYLNNQKIKNYLLFENKNNQWIATEFGELPVFFVENTGDGSPFFIKQEGTVIAVPYFISKNDASQMANSLGANWQVQPRNLLLTLDAIFNHELGNKITIIPPKR